tara:strand:+ start:12514 stop:12810 length:297 start_codon:yes stop_codon:yes gene_type:complete
MIEITVNLEENEYEKLVKDTAALSREELKAVIDYWEDEAENLLHEEIQYLAITELKKRNKEREEQIKFLNQSLLASSRTGRWLSHAKSFLRRYVEIKY